MKLNNYSISTMHMIFSKKYHWPVILLLLFQINMAAQISISEAGEEPDASAILDISSTDKGMLIPRMDSTGREAISSPAEGLMVYDSTTHSFWFYQNSAWAELVAGKVAMLSDADADTKIQVEESTDEDIIRFDVDGEQAMMIDSTGYVGIGTEPTDRFQVDMGLSTASSLSAISTSGSLYTTSSGSGWQSYTATVSGELEKVELRSYYATGTRTIRIYEGQGTSGTLLGTGTVDPGGENAWIEVAFMGITQDAGQQYTIWFDSRVELLFSNSNPYPDGQASLDSGNDFQFKAQVFSYAFFSVGDSSVTVGAYSLPKVDGENGQALLTDGSGKADWGDLGGYLDNTDEQTLSLSSDVLSISNGNSVDLGGYLDNTDEQTIDQFSLSNDTLYLSLANDGQSPLSVNLNELNKTLLADADADTKIQVEESTDQDIIRFDVAGSQAMMIDSTGYVGIGTEPTDRFQVDMGLSTASSISASNTTGSTYYSEIDDSWQSYTATISGELEKIALKFYNATGTRTISIYEGQGTSGNFLGSATAEPPVTNGWLEIDFSGIAQEAGQIYSIGFSDNSGILFSTSNPYSGGRMKENANYDHQFKVYVLSNSSFSVGENGVTIGGYSLPESDGSNGQVLSTDGSGSVAWADAYSANYTLPSADGSNGQVLSTDGNGNVTWADAIPIGTIQMWATSSPPAGWLLCDGSTFSTSTYSELNTVLGGNTLPDFSGRFPLGAGNSGTTGSSSHSLGSNGGEEKHVLTISEMPSHSHDITYSSKNKSGSGGEVSDLEASASTTSTEPEGGGQAHNNMPPFYTINFIIKAE